MRVRILALVICFAVALTGPASAAEPRVIVAPFAQRSAVQPMPVVDGVHQPPVDAPIIDGFRPPDGPYAAGNRGLEYDTTTGQIVVASSSGVVTFSGQVGGNLFVTIRHDATLRTTVGFVHEVLVATGESVTQGQAIAVAGHTMHFTARYAPEGGSVRYIDPELLFRQFKVVVRLIPDPDN